MLTEDDRGFHFAVFQSDSTRDTVRVWLDGSEDYESYSHKDFVALAFDIEPTMRRALMDYSYFLWDVRKRCINRLRFQQDPESLRKALVDHKPAKAEEDKAASITENYFQSETKVDVDKVSIKT